MAYPVIDERIKVNDAEVNTFVNLLSASSSLLQSVNASNIDTVRQTLNTNVISCHETLTKWFREYNGRFNSVMIALYVKTAQFTVQLSALNSFKNISPTIQALFTELQAFARNSQSLSSNTQLKFNLLQAGSTSGITEFLQVPKVSFQQIIGFDEQKARIRSITSPLLEALRENRANILLLYGPPGTGKSYFAEAMAYEQNADFIVVSAAQLYDPSIGVSERKLDGIFQTLRIYPKRAVLFFDEFEQIFPSRASNNALELGKSLTVQLMQLLSGPFGNLPSNVTVVAATNILQALDPAIRSRMAPQIYIGLPSIEHKYEFMLKYFEPEDIRRIFSYFEGNPQVGFSNYSNRDLYNLCEGVLFAQIAAVQNSPNYQWSSTARRSLRGTVTPGFYIFTDSVEGYNIVTYSQDLLSNIESNQIVVLNEDEKLVLAEVIQRPDPLLFVSRIADTINPITEEDLRSYASVNN